MAHRLARSIYAMLTTGTAYVATTFDDVAQRQLIRLSALAGKLGYALQPNTTQPATAG